MQSNSQCNVLRSNSREQMLCPDILCHFVSILHMSLSYGQPHTLSVLNWFHLKSIPWQYQYCSVMTTHQKSRRHKTRKKKERRSTLSHWQDGASRFKKANRQGKSHGRKQCNRKRNKPNQDHLYFEVKKKKKRNHCGWQSFRQKPKIKDSTIAFPY